MRRLWRSLQDFPCGPEPPLGQDAVVPHPSRRTAREWAAYEERMRRRARWRGCRDMRRRGVRVGAVAVLVLVPVVTLSRLVLG